MQLSSKVTNSILSLFVAVSVMPPQVMAQTTETSVDTTKATSTTTSTTVKPDPNLEIPSAQIKGELWRKNPPSVPPPRAFKLPSITNYKLDNGLKVQLVEDHRFPFLTVALGIKAGSALEPKDKLGLAEMTADMLMKAPLPKKVKRLPTKQISLAVG